MTPSLEWDTQLLLLYTRLFTRGGVPTSADYEAKMDGGKQPTVITIKQNVQPCFQTSWKWYFTVAHWFPVSNLAIPHFHLQYCFAFFIVHTFFLETWLFDRLSDFSLFITHFNKTTICFGWSKWTNSVRAITRLWILTKFKPTYILAVMLSLSILVFLWYHFLSGVSHSSKYLKVLYKLNENRRWGHIRLWWQLHVGSLCCYGEKLSSRYMVMVALDLF